MLNRYFPLFVLIAASVEMLFAVAIILRVQFVLDLWPMEGTTRLSFLFLASIFAAGATSQFWVLWRKQHGAFVGVALDYITIMAPAAVFLLSIGLSRSDGGLTAFGSVFLVGAAFGVALLLWSRRFTINDPQPTPAIVRWSFAVFVVALVILGGVMALHLVDVMPWAVTDDGAVIYGLMFIGAATYFAYGFLRPSWQNAAGQLAGFLAYDLVLIVPFIQHFARVTPDLRPNLVIYTAGVALSGLLCIYYLFINPETRVWGQEAKREAPVSARA
jgi:hypothetical protein